MRNCNVKKAICSHHIGFVSIEDGFEELLKVLEKYKNFLYGYLIFNPNFSGISLNIIKKHISHKNIVGVKIHPSWHLCCPNDLKYKDLWNLAEEKRFPILTHSWSPLAANPDQKFSNPLLFKDVIKNYPNIKLILAHAGGRGEYFYKVMNLLEKNENLYIDFAADIFFRGLLKEFVSNVGSERILFGTDLPWTDARYHIANVLYADINENDKKNIFSLNASKLFNLKA